MRVIDLGSDTRPAAASSGIVARRVLVLDGTTAGNVKLPAATPEVTIIGVSKEKVSAANNVAFQFAGVAPVESDGSAVINPGDTVVGVGTTGRIKSAGSGAPAGALGRCVNDAQVPATAGALVYVLLAPSIANNLANVTETLVADSAATITAAQLLGRYLRQVPTTARTVTLDTAANIDLAMPNARIGDTFAAILHNNSAGANAITIAGATGLTLYPAIPGTVAQNKTVTMHFLRTAAGAWNVYFQLGA